MVDKNKLSVSILIVLILISLSLAGGASYFLQKEKAKNLSLQTELDNIKSLLKITETRLDESKKTIQDLETKAKDAMLQADSLTTQLEQEKSAKQEALNQIDQLQADLEKQKSLRADLEQKLIQAQEDAKKIKEQLNDLTSKRTELETKIKAQEAQRQLQAQADNVELGTIVVSSEEKPAEPVEQPQVKEKATVKSVASSLEGKVLVINKDYNFAVINLGDKDGVKTGQAFSVYNQDKYLGDIKIEKIHDSMSAAEFGSEDMKNKVSEGDRVVLKNS